MDSLNNLNNQRTVAFLEDLNVRLKRFDEMIQQAREDIMRAIAIRDSLCVALNTPWITSNPPCPDSKIVMVDAKTDCPHCGGAPRTK